MCGVVGCGDGGLVEESIGEVVEGGGAQGEDVFGDPGVGEGGADWVE